MKKLAILFLSFSLFISCKETFKTKKNTQKEVKKQISKKTTIQFSTTDDIKVTADVYMTDNKNNPFILLFHQARFSRGEYLEIAPKLNALGFNCMAIDQRSGKEVNDVINKTHLQAVAKKLPTEYLDALPDLEASVTYVLKKYQPNKLIIWGSSYSSVFSFIVGSHFKNQLSGLLSFYTGEYLTFEGKTIKDYAKNIEFPVFITSAKNEVKEWKDIFDAIPSENKVGFIPNSKGKHGSKALWESHENNAEYWKAVTKFLMSIK
jgi:dienelactone hydrolase